MALERLDPAEQHNKMTLDHYARYLFACVAAEGKRVLDVACGFGYGSRLLAASGAREVVGVDVAPDALAYAHDHYAHPLVSYILKDITALSPDIEGHFDLITCFETLEHVPNPMLALDALTSMLPSSRGLVV